MSRPRDRAALRREERRLGDLRTLAARAQGFAMGRSAPGIAGAVAAFAPLAALALLVASAPLDAAWRDAAEAHLVVVPDPDLAAAQAGAGSRMAAVERILGAAAAPQDGAVRQRFLAPWLGADLDASTLPGLLAMKAAPDPALAAAVLAAAPGSTIAAAPADTASGLARLDRALRAASRLALVLGLALGIACLHLAARLAVGPARTSIRVLATLGERPAVLARRAARRTGFAAAAGGVFGAGAAVPLLLLAASGAPASPCFVAVAATPPLCGAIAGLFAGLRAQQAARMSQAGERPA